MDWTIRRPRGPRRGLDTAAFGEAFMEWLCAAMGHAGACQLLNSRRFPYTGYLFCYFTNQAQTRQARLGHPEPIQSTYTAATY